MVRVPLHRPPLHLPIALFALCAACASAPQAPPPAPSAAPVARTAEPAPVAKTAPPAPATRTAPPAPLAKAPPPSTGKKPAVVAKAPPAAPKASPEATRPAAPAAAPLDVRTLEERLKDTPAIGIMTKLSLKNQVDDLLDQFRAYHAGRLKATLAQLRRPYDLLLMKVLSLLQDADPALAKAIHDSREAIWAILTDRQKFSEYA